MKKTTYIIMAVLALCLLLSFSVPAILFKPTSRPYVGNIEHIISPGGEAAEVLLDSFTNLNCALYAEERYYDPILYIHNENGTQRILSLRVEEADGISSPKLTVNPGWTGYLKAVVADSVLTVNFNLDSFVPDFVAEEGEETSFDRGSVTFIVPEECSQVGVLQVPRGMLDGVVSDRTTVTLAGFRDATMTVRPNDGIIGAEDCSFITYTSY